MKIALVIANYDSTGGGAERWTDHHVRKLIERGHEVHIVARQIKGPPEGAVCHAFAQPRWRTRLQRAIPAGGHRLAFARTAERFLKQERFDLIHDMADGWYADVVQPQFGCRAANYRAVTDSRPAWERIIRRIMYVTVPRNFAFRKMERLQYADNPDRPGKIVIAVSDLVRSHMQRYFRVPDERVRVIYNGIDTSVFSPGGHETERQRVRKELGFEDRTVFLLIAVNYKLKGLDPLLAAMARLVQQGQRVGLVVVGNGDVDSYQQRATKLGCAEAVRILGRQLSTLPYYHAADVHVHPTYYDACSLTVLEAMACGKPVITTRLNGAAGFVTPGSEGFLIDVPDNLDGLCSHMASLQDAALRQKMGIAARAQADRRCGDFARSVAACIPTSRRVAGDR